MPPPHQRHPTGSETGLSRASAFCHVEKRGEDGSRQFIVHTEDPKLIVEFEDDGGVSGPAHAPLIRRVCIPNAPIGGYHSCAAVVGFALTAMESLRPWRKNARG